MRVICAPDSFKETIAAGEAAKAMADGAKRAGDAIEVDECPVADGGEGTLDSLIGAMGGTDQQVTVTGPLGEPVAARLGITGDGAIGVVELAQASGLALVPSERRDPTKTTTYGTGELIHRAAASGCREVIVCIGGSATVDGATGIAQALGARFYAESGMLIAEPISGGRLRDIARIELPDQAALPRLRVACDVTNPLCGPNGAAAVYGPQKGATPQQVRDLDAGLAHLAKLLGADPDQPGFGAAGGAGFGLVAMLGAQLVRGIDLVLDVVGFDDRCRGAALVLTGEGRLDAQSLSGKASTGVARRAGTLGVPTIAIVGSMGEGADRCMDAAESGCFVDVISLADRFGLERSMRDPAALIRQVANEVVAAHLG